MAKPVVVIVGRPNVGKSTLFNRIVGGNVAIVEDVPGVTRDRNYHDAEWEGKGFVAVDTGGFYPRHDDNIFSQIKEQALFAVDEADVIIHLFDGKDGLNPYDSDLAEILRASGKQVLWAVNKVDAETREDRAYDFYGLGLDEVLTVSAATGYNFAELMDKVAASLPEYEPEEAGYPRVAIVGRPNVGKSTMVNALLGKKRLLVSPVPGTTRDSIDTVCTYYGRKYILIDTAGIRRKDRRGYSIERFAMVRALRSIERADVAVIVIDSSEGLVTEDQKIAGMVHDQGKSALFVLNKWDLVEDPDNAYKKLTEEIGRMMWFLPGAPVLTTSGQERTRITKLYSHVDELMAERRKRVPTAELNKLLERMSVPPHKGKPVKLFYLTQYGTEPPGFALFVNRPEGVRDNNLRHLERRLREAFGFKGSPLRIKVKGRA
jgi:GTP-binding protein